MQRQPPVYPVANSSIKMPDVMSDTPFNDEDVNRHRLQLINFAHSQWGFNNWSWTVTKQEVDFVDFINGQYCAGVVAYVNVSVKTFGIHRENIGYATCIAHSKGLALYKSRKSAVTNALRETLLSFGGSVAAELRDLLESGRAELDVENNQNVANRTREPPRARPEPDGRAPLGPPAPPPGPPAPPLGPPPLCPPAPPLVPPPAGRPGRAPATPAGPRANSNEGAKIAAPDLDEEEARAERKRRQKQAQEEFRLKHQAKHYSDAKQDSSTNSSNIDKFLLDIPTQDIVIEATDEDTSKRKSPGAEGGVAKRRTGSFSKLNIVKRN